MEKERASQTGKEGVRSEEVEGTRDSKKRGTTKCEGTEKMSACTVKISLHLINWYANWLCANSVWCA